MFSVDVSTCSEERPTQSHPSRTSTDERNLESSSWRAIGSKAFTVAVHRMFDDELPTMTAIVPFSSVRRPPDPSVDRAVLRITSIPDTILDFCSSRNATGAEEGQ